MLLKRRCTGQYTACSESKFAGQSRDRQQPPLATGKRRGSEQTRQLATGAAQRARKKGKGGRTGRRGGEERGTGGEWRAQQRAGILNTGAPTSQIEHAFAQRQ